MTACKPLRLTLGVLSLLSFASLSHAQTREPAANARAAEGYARAPLAFEKNAGQTDAKVKFLSRGNGYALFLTPNEAVFSLRKATAKRAAKPENGEPSEKPSKPEKVEGAVVRMQLQGANPRAEATSFSQLPGTSNYFIGNDSRQWRTGVANYAKVGFREVYPGVDVVYYGNQRRLEYDFVAKAGSDPSAIRLKFAGAKKVSALSSGELLLDTGNGSLRWRSPVAYQEAGGRRVPVSAKYVLKGGGEVCFAVGAYDHSKPLVIDPELIYSTFLGGSGQFDFQDPYPYGDQAVSIAVDGAGAAYVTGQTYSVDFPVTPGAFQTANKATAPLQPSLFVTKLSDDRATIIYSTYIGRGKVFGDSASAIAVDGAGAAYVTGQTYSTDFPTTPGAFQRVNNANTEGHLAPTAFLTKLSADGSALAYSTYLGGSTVDYASGIAVDGAGAAYLVGTTYSKDFPVTTGAFQSTLLGYYATFVTKFSADGSALIYSTYLGGSSGSRIRVDGAGAAYVVGEFASKDFPTTPGAFQTTSGSSFITKLSADGAKLLYSTRLGGSKQDRPTGLAVDGAGAAYVVGEADSKDFPTTPGAFQRVNNANTKEHEWPNAFVTKLSADGTKLIYSTYLGGNGIDYAVGVAVDGKGAAYVTGQASSLDFPITAGAFQPIKHGFYSSAFVTKLSADGTKLLSSTYLGGNISEYARGVAVDGAGAAYVTGQTYSSDFPTSPEAFQTLNWSPGGSAFVAKLAMTASGRTHVVIAVPRTIGAADGCLAATIFRKENNAALNKPLVFILDGTVVGTALSEQGVARLKFNTSALLKGTQHTLQVDFAGDSSDLANSKKLTVKVIEANAMIAAESHPSQDGTLALLVAYLTDFQKNPIFGTVAFQIDGADVGSATTDENGKASLTYQMPDALSTGRHAVMATFAGDASHGIGFGGFSVLVAPRIRTSPVLASSVSGRPGETVPFIATLTRNTDGAGVAGGTIAFILNGIRVGAMTTDATGKAVFAYKIGESLPVGKAVLTANFTGDSKYISSTTLKRRSLTINPSPTKIYGRNVTGKGSASVTLSARLTRTTDKAGVAGRTVRFQIDGADVGSATTDADGNANLIYVIPSAATLGKHPMTLTFDGDPFYLKYSGSGVSLTVQ